MVFPVERLRLPGPDPTPEEIFRVLADSLPQIVWIMRADGTVEYMNPEWTNFTGLSQAEVSPEDWRRVTHPDDYENNLAQHRRARDESANLEVEFRLRRKDGTFRWFVARSVPIWGRDGKVFRRFGTATDIDDTKRNQAQFEALADSIPQIVWSIDSDGKTYYNKKWWDYSGLDRSMSSPAAAANQVHPDDVEPLLAVWENSRIKNADWEAEYRLRRADGTYRWHLGRVIAVTDEDGKTMRRYGTATDIDDLRRLSEEQKRLETELRAAIDIRDQFLAVCSHELKTPLTLLELHAESFRRKYMRDNFADLTPELLRKHFERVEAHLKRLNRRISDMLDVTRISSGRLAIERKEVELGALARAAIENLTPRFESSASVVTYAGAGPVPCRCDSDRIEQVVTNLLENALKYGMGRPIEVRTRREGKFAVLEIRDRGIGVAAADHARIFGQFERADSSSGIAGLGLGLYIASEIVAAHDGKIAVESALGEGSLFRVTLPD